MKNSSCYSRRFACPSISRGTKGPVLPGLGLRFREESSPGLGLGRVAAAPPAARPPRGRGSRLLSSRASRGAAGKRQRSEEQRQEGDSSPIHVPSMLRRIFRVERKNPPGPTLRAAIRASGRTTRGTALRPSRPPCDGEISSPGPGESASRSRPSPRAARTAAGSISRWCRRSRDR